MSLLERGEVVNRAWQLRLRSQAPGIQFMHDHLSPGQTAIDIGANQGAYSYWMSRLVGGSGRVLAFEPQPALARYLARIRSSFGMAQLTVINEALSATGGTRMLAQPASNPATGATLAPPSGEGRSIQVWTSVLDTYLDRAGCRPVHFIRCSAEGDELEVFRGAARTLLNDRPILLVECQDLRNGGGQTQRVFALLQDLGYEGFFFKGPQRLPISGFEPEIHQGTEDAPYLDTFAFLPES